MNDLVRQTSESIANQRSILAEAIVARQFQQNPMLESRYGKVGRERCLEDANFHLVYLAESIAVNSVALFADYIAWAKVLLQSYQIPVQDLIFNLKVMGEVLHEHLSAPMAALVDKWIDTSLLELEQSPSEIQKTNFDENLAELAQHYLNALLDGDRRTATQLILDAVRSGTSIHRLYLDIFQETQYEIGRLWQTNQISVAQEHFCTAATQLNMSLLYPYIFSTPKHGRCLVATAIGGELHEIGIRMVADLLELEGWDCFYLGANTPTTSIIRALKERNADVLAISATMGFHVSRVAQLISEIRNAHPTVKIVVGGRPFNMVPDLWKQIGADGYGMDAESTIEVVNDLMAEH